MDDVARAVVAEDRVILVLAGRREAAVAALLEADELLVAEVPAPRPLIDVPADRTLVADLRRPDLPRRVDDCGVQFRGLCVLREVDDLAGMGFAEDRGGEADELGRDLVARHRAQRVAAYDRCRPLVRLAATEHEPHVRGRSVRTPGRHGGVRAELDSLRERADALVGERLRVERGRIGAPEHQRRRDGPGDGKPRGQ